MTVVPVPPHIQRLCRVAGMQLGPLPGLLTFPAGLALQDDKTLFVASGNAVLRIRLDQ